MLKNACLLAKIGADTAENKLNFAEILPIRDPVPLDGLVRRQRRPRAADRVRLLAADEAAHVLRNHLQGSLFLNDRSKKTIGFINAVPRTEHASVFGTENYSVMQHFGICRLVILLANSEFQDLQARNAYFVDLVKRLQMLFWLLRSLSKMEDAWLRKLSRLAIN